MLNKRVDVMVDIETLGTSQDAMIIQIAAASFDITTGEIDKTFNRTVDISSEKELTISGDTLKWWLNTDKELFTEIVNREGHSEAVVLHLFSNWVSNIADKSHSIYLWGNGILFDNNIIKHKLEKSGRNYPIHYRNDRDVRTILELACYKLGVGEREAKDRYTIFTKDVKAHDAGNDVANQVKLVSECFKILTN